METSNLSWLRISIHDSILWITTLWAWKCHKGMCLYNAVSGLSWFILLSFIWCSWYNHGKRIDNTFFFSRLIHGSCIFPCNLGNHLLKKQIGLETYLSKAIKFNLLSCPIRRQPEMNRVRFRKKIRICSLQPYCAHQPGGHTRHSVVKPASWEFLGYKKNRIS